MRLRKNQMQKIGDELKTKTLLNFKKRIEDDNRRGDGAGLQRHFQMLLDYSNQLPESKQLSIEQVLSILPSNLREATRAELDTLLQTQEVADE